MRRVLLLSISAIAVACSRQSEPEPVKADPGARPLPTGVVTPAADKGFTLADATEGLSGTGALTATLDTSKGKIECKLFDDKAPQTVANFVGLARGVRAWLDPQTGQMVKRAAYDGTTFHRVIAGFMIQGGDPKGDGTGEPGYVIPDEVWKGAKHDRAGQLCMANRGPNTNGAQFFITDDAAPHLDGGYTIFGQCGNLDVVHAIANAKKGAMDRPVQKITINSITISRK